MAERNVSTVRQFSKKYPAFPQGGLRWMIFNENSNGMAGAGVVIRAGRKVLIDEDKFFAWLDRQNGRTA